MALYDQEVGRIEDCMKLHIGPERSCLRFFSIFFCFFFFACVSLLFICLFFFCWHQENQKHQKIKKKNQNSKKTRNQKRKEKH